jgi:hypothetical protein
MNTTFNPAIKKFLKQTFFVSTLLSSSAFGFIRMMMYPLPIEFAEDGLIFLRTLLTGWLLVMLGKGAFEALVFIAELVQRISTGYIKSITGKIYNYRTAKFFAAYLPFSKVREGRIKIYNKGLRVREAEAMLQD